MTAEATKVYLAGPMRGYELYNFPLFQTAAEQLRAWGHVVVSPHEIDIAQGFVDIERDADGNFEKVELTDRFDMKVALRRDFQAILDADMVVMLPGWQESSGVAAERRVAIEVGVPCFEIVVKHGQPWLSQVADDYMPPLRVLSNPDDTGKASSYQPAEITGMGGEVRVVDPVTGGEKGRKLARMELLPGDALRAVAEHFGRGAAKYSDRNWEKGYDWSLSFGAMQRHAWAWWGGEEIDDDGFFHRDAFAWHALVLLAFALRGAGTDDRPSTIGVHHGAES